MAHYNDRCVTLYSSCILTGVSVSTTIRDRVRGSTSVAIICDYTTLPRTTTGGLIVAVSSSGHVAGVAGTRISNVLPCDVNMDIIGHRLLVGVMDRTCSTRVGGCRGSILPGSLGGLGICNFRRGNCITLLSGARACCRTDVTLLGHRMERRLFAGRHPVLAGAHSSVPAGCYVNSSIGGSLITSNYVVRNIIGGDVLFHNIGITGNTIIRGYVLVRSASIGANTILSGIVTSGRAIVDRSIVLGNAPRRRYFVEGSRIM